MWQLIYTSAPSGLTPGRTGFCTVARHREIPERLVSILEQISVYEPPEKFLRVPIFSFRNVTVGNDTCGVISRYCDAGLDYTSRRNFLVHHLIFTRQEMAPTLPPAEIAHRWNGWISNWSEPPRWLENDTAAPEIFSNPQTKLPAKFWEKISTDAGNAALLCPEGMPLEISLRENDATAALHLFAESSLLLRAGAWSVPFTTCLQKNDTAAQFPWQRAPQNDTAETENRIVISPGTLSKNPANSPAAKFARTGIAPLNQPRAALSPVISGERRQQIPAPPNDTVAEKKSNKTLLIGGIGIITFILAFATIRILSRNGTDDFSRKMTPPQKTTPVIPQNQTTTSIASSFSLENLRRELDAARDAADWQKAATLWKQYSREDPAGATSRKVDFELVQTRLPKALADSLEKKFATLSPDYKAPDRAELHLSITAARQQLRDIGAITPPEIQAQITRLEKQLTVLDTLPEMPPPLSFVLWENATAGNRGSGEIFTTINAKKLNEFLSKNHGEITLSIAPQSAWNGTADALALNLPANAFELGKGLYISPENTTVPRLRFLPDRRGLSVRFERVLHDKMTPLENLFSTEKSFLLKFDDPSENAAARVLLLNPNSPPAPAHTSLEMLKNENDTVEIPAWICDALRRFEMQNSLLILLPSGGNDFAKDYTGTKLNRGEVQLAMRRAITKATQEVANFDRDIARLDGERQTANDTAEIDTALAEKRRDRALWHQRKLALEARLSTLDDKASSLSKQGAPWTAGLVDHRTGFVLPLIIFE